MQNIEKNKSCYFPAPQVLLLEAVAAHQHLLAFNNQIHHCYTALVGQQFLTSESYEIHELAFSVDTKSQSQYQDTDVNIGTALLACIEFLEAENTQLKATQLIRNELRLEDIQHDDKLICFLQDLHHNYVMLTAFLSFWDQQYIT